MIENVLQMLFLFNTDFSVCNNKTVKSMLNLAHIEVQIKTVQMMLI